MDAAQKLIKNIAILAATGLLLSAVGLAQPTLVATPTTVAIGASGFNTANVTSSDNGTTVITYSIGAPTFTSGDPQWLTVSGGTTTPSTLTFTAHNVAGLSAAVHTATVVLHPANHTQDLTITATFDTSGGGGGGGSTLIPSQTSVALTSAASTAQITITNSSVA